MGGGVAGGEEEAPGPSARQGRHRWLLPQLKENLWVGTGSRWPFQIPFTKPGWSKLAACHSLREMLGDKQASGSRSCWTPTAWQQTSWNLPIGSCATPHTQVGSGVEMPLSKYWWWWNCQSLEVPLRSRSSLSWLEEITTSAEWKCPWVDQLSGGSRGPGRLGHYCLFRGSVLRH